MAPESMRPAPLSRSLWGGVGSAGPAASAEGAFAPCPKRARAVAEGCRCVRRLARSLPGKGDCDAVWGLA